MKSIETLDLPKELQNLKSENAILREQIQELNNKVRDNEMNVKMKIEGLIKDEIQVMKREIESTKEETKEYKKFEERVAETEKNLTEMQKMISISLSKKQEEITSKNCCKIMKEELEKRLELEKSNTSAIIDKKFESTLKSQDLLRKQIRSIVAKERNNEPKVEKNEAENNQVMPSIKDVLKTLPEFIAMKQRIAQALVNLRVIIS